MGNVIWKAHRKRHKKYYADINKTEQLTPSQDLSNTDVPDCWGEVQTVAKLISKQVQYFSKTIPSINVLLLEYQCELETVQQLRRESKRRDVDGDQSLLEGFVHSLLKVGQMCNRLLRFSEAQQCFALAQEFLSGGESVLLGRTYDILTQTLCCSLQVLVYADVFEGVVRMLEDLEIYHELLCSYSSSDVPSLCRLALMETLVDASDAFLQGSRWDSAKAILESYPLLSLGLVDKLTAGADSNEKWFARCLCARVTTNMATVMYMQNQVSGESSAVPIYEIAVQKWHDLDWPLDYTKFILSCFLLCAKNSIKMNSTEEEGKITNQVLGLYQDYWKYCNQQVSIAEFLYELGCAQYEKSVHKSVLSAEKAIEVLQEYKYHKSHGTRVLDELFMWKGACLYMLALGRKKLGSYSQSAQNYRECIPILQMSCHRASLRSQYSKFMLTTLAQAYEDLGNTLTLYKASAEESLFYCGKALENQEFLRAGRGKVIQATMADTYHLQAALLELKGKMKEAEKKFEHAEEMFVLSTESSTNAFSYIAYGYFLFCRKRYQEAEMVMWQACILGKTDKSCVSFSKDEMAILTDELKFELQHTKDYFTTLCEVTALYFCILSLQHIANGEKRLQKCLSELEMMLTEDKLDQYKDFLIMNHGSISEIHHSSLSMLGYTYRALGRHRDAVKAFQRAFERCGNEAALLNTEIELKHLSEGDITGTGKKMD